MGIEFFRENRTSYGFVPDLVKDLNLHWIARNMVNEKYGDIPAIMEILQNPLRTEAEIEERQQVVMAACAHPKRMEELLRFSARQGCSCRQSTIRFTPMRISLLILQDVRMPL